MRFHIVRSNETVSDILTLYNLTKEELIKENKHITSWRQLVPGTKLKIPVITENVEQGIKDMEPFIEDYYPKLKPFLIKTKQEEKQEVEEESAIEETKVKLDIKDIPELNKYQEDDDYPQYLYSYYSPYYYPYYAQPSYYNYDNQIETEEDE